MALQEKVGAQRAKEQAAASEKAAGAGKAFLAANAQKPGVKTTASGLQYRVIAEGSGKSPTAADTVTVNYRGTLVDGTEFDSSYKRGQPASFPVGGVIAGWTEALQLMKVGSKYELVIPPELAYGANGPLANQVLVFEVELLGATEPTGGRGVTCRGNDDGMSRRPRRTALRLRDRRQRRRPGGAADPGPRHAGGNVAGRIRRRRWWRSGFRVVTFDNRDCGGSSRLESAGVPNIPRAMTRALLDLPVSAPYTLTDMASTPWRVLDATGLERAHVVGVSMGGMIAQVCAATQPRRVRTLTSVMSTTGNPRPSVALGKTRALRAVLRRPPGDPSIDQVVDHLMFVFGMIGSPGFRQHASQLRPHFERVARRGLYPAGTSRQLAAILASGDRREMLQRITAPTLVIHGADDPLVRLAGGRDTAANIRGARLKIIPGMGHDFPPALMTGIAVMIAEHCRSSHD